MNKDEYVEYALLHKDAISNIIKTYHPVNREPGRRPHKHLHKEDKVRWFCRVCQSARQKTLRKEKKNAVR